MSLTTTPIGLLVSFRKTKYQSTSESTGIVAPDNRTHQISRTKSLALFNKFIIEPFRQEKKLLLIVGGLFVLANLVGYELGVFSTRTAGVNDHESAVQLVQSQSSSSLDDEGSPFQKKIKRSLGNFYASIPDSWDNRSAASIIFQNITISSFLAIFSVIPLTALLGLYKELEIGLMMGMAGAWIAAPDGNLRLVIAMPHFFLETPATLLVTTLCIRSAILIFRKKYGTLGERITAGYTRWVYAAPILVFLFVSAGIVEAYLTPYLVHHLLVL